MSAKMGDNSLKRQLLIEGDDKYFYIITDTAVIVDPKVKRLIEGDVVSFGWPEGAKVPIIYKGRILKFSTKESDLQDLIKKIKNQRSKERNTSKENKKRNLSQAGNSETNSEKKRSKNTSIADENAKDSKKVVDSKTNDKILSHKRESNVLCAAEQFKILERISETDIKDFSQATLLKEKFMKIRNIALSLLDEIDTLEEDVERMNTKGNDSRTSHLHSFSTKKLTPATSNIEIDSLLKDKEESNIQPSIVTQSYESTSDEETDESSKDKDTDFKEKEKKEHENKNNVEMESDGKNYESDDDQKIPADQEDKTTLLYPTHIPGFTCELYPDCDIYVEEESLKKVKKEANNPTGYARSLLSLIFNPDALSSCSLQGKGKSKKPGLNSRGLDGLLTAVQKRIKNKINWEKVSNATIKASLRSRLIEAAKKSKSV